MILPVLALAAAAAAPMPQPSQPLQSATFVHTLRMGVQDRSSIVVSTSTASPNTV